MNNNPQISMERLLTILMTEVIFARTHLGIAKGIRAADPAVVHTARTFFGLTHDAHLNAALMYAAKLHDKTRGTISVKSAIDKAEQVAGTFIHATAERVRQITALAKDQLSELEKTLLAVESRRNEYLAHLDPRTILDPTGIDTRAALTIDELDQLLVETGNILNDISQFYHGVFSGLELIDARDYETPWRLIAEAKCAQAEKFEKEFHEPWPYERPQICQKEGLTDSIEVHDR